MITWRDEGFVLAARPQGETSVLLEVLTRDHGRHAGILRGGAGRRLRGVIGPGAQLDLVWSARLEDQLGQWRVEPLRSRAQPLGDRLAVAGMAAVTALLRQALPERDPHPALHDRSAALLDLLGQSEIWPLGYLRWEMALLEDLGFGLDLSACVVTGVNDDLAFVSPRSGRAVGRHAAGEWADRLLPLPPVLKGEAPRDAAEILTALATTGWFVSHRLLAAQGGEAAPPARARLLAEIARAAA